MKEKTLARAGLLCALLASGTLPRNGARLLAQMPAAVSPSDSASTAAAAVEVKHEDGDFFRRLGRAYAEDWNGTAPETPEAPRRGFPAPLASPPFPFSDWPYGAADDTMAGGLASCAIVARVRVAGRQVPAITNASQPWRRQFSRSRQTERNAPGDRGHAADCLRRS